MLWLVFAGYILFWYIWHKQTYMAGHYAGDKETMPNVLRVYEVLGLLFILYYAVRASISLGWYSGPLLVVGGLVGTFLLVPLETSFVKSIHREDFARWQGMPDMFMTCLNEHLYTADMRIVVAGFVVNPVIGVLLHLAL